MTEKTTEELIEESKRLRRRARATMKQKKSDTPPDPSDQIFFAKSLQDSWPRTDRFLFNFMAFIISIHGLPKIFGHEFSFAKSYLKVTFKFVAERIDE